MEEFIKHFKHYLGELIMSTVEDQILGLITSVETLTEAVNKLGAAPVVDFTPIITAITEVQTTVSGIAAQLQPTPVAAAPTVEATTSTTVEAPTATPSA